MKIFVIGLSQTGKTTFAKKIVRKMNESLPDFGFKHISASGFVRENFVSKPDASRADLEAFGIATVQNNPDAPIEYVKKHTNDLKDNCVIEGVRNPRDFCHLFDPRTDRIFVQAGLSGISKDQVSAFDYGPVVIRGIIDWHTNTGIWMKETCVSFYPFHPKFAEGIEESNEELISNLIQAIQKNQVR